jgi:ribonucleoside-diphosphate reductase alpha chain
MLITKRNGQKEPVDLQKIINSLTKKLKGLPDVDVTLIATKTIGGLYDGATTREIDELSIQIAIGYIQQDPNYSLAASFLLADVIYKEVEQQEIQSFSQSIKFGYDIGMINDRVFEFVKTNARKLNSLAVSHLSSDELFEYFGLRTVYDRYLLKHPVNRMVFETPQYWLLRVACGLCNGDLNDTIDLYKSMSLHDYLTSTPTLFNSATMREQLSSCYLLDSPKDDLGDIYKRKTDMALLSKWAGGIGVDYTLVRPEGALIRGTNGFSNGIIPFIHSMDRDVVAVNQGGKRKGAACVYLESWHPDIMSFLDLRKNSGDEYKRAHNLNIANWIPDELMRRSDNKQEWTLISPDYVGQAGTGFELTRTYGETFEKLYVALEQELEALDVKPRWYKKVPAQEIYGKMIRTLSETGNGWMNFKDTCNNKSNQVRQDTQHRVRLSNLCTEILEVVDSENTAVCNLGSINIGKFVKSNGKIDWARLKKTVKIAVKALNNVIDINYYPIPEAERSNNNWRPVGLGIMGVQDMFFKMSICFDSEQALELTRKVHSFIYYHALDTSCEIAQLDGTFNFYDQSQMYLGKLQFDLWNVVPVEFDGMNWNELREKIKQHGVRNSLLIAIAPTATIASIVGAYECIEPLLTNLFKRETLSGEFVQVNNYLVNELKKIGLWNANMYEKIKHAEGSIQNILEIPKNIRDMFKTAWEHSMKSLIDLAVARGPYVDQSQSLNLFMENPTIGKVSSMYMYCWKQGVKTSYYLRSRSATSINKTTNANVEDQVKIVDDAQAIACSLENPEACESCT